MNVRHADLNPVGRRRLEVELRAVGNDDAPVLDGETSVGVVEKREGQRVPVRIESPELADMRAGGRVLEHLHAVEHDHGRRRVAGRTLVLIDVLDRDRETRLGRAAL